MHEWVLSTTPFAFRSARGAYSAFRLEVSQLLDVHPADICLVGSGQLGFSLNPWHLLSAFDRSSDLDLVVVSSDIFDHAWRELIATQSILAAGSDRDRLRKTRDSFFDGYLRHDKLPLSSALSKSWFPKLAGPFKSDVAKRHEVKAWLFKSWWHAVGYYANGLARVQPHIRELLKIG